MSYTNNVGPLFEAQFDNEFGCNNCEKDLNEGDLIAYVEGSLCCESCVEAAREEEKTTNETLLNNLTKRTLQ